MIQPRTGFTSPPAYPPLPPPAASMPPLSASVHSFDNQGDAKHDEPRSDAEFRVMFDAQQATLERRLEKEFQMVREAGESMEVKGRPAINPVPNPANLGTMTPSAHQRVEDDGHEELNVNDELEGAPLNAEHERFRALAVDAIAQGTARALAGAKQKPTQESVSGYLGTRNVENEDIQNSSATGTNKNAQGGQIPLEERKGDAFLQAKESHNTTTDTLRPTFGIAPANAVVPTRRQQVESDLLFNDFSTVAPGHGLGVTNKMFLMENARDNKIVYREPLAEPRKYDGPTGGVEVVPLQWQNQITRRDRNTLAAKAIAEEASGVLVETRAGFGSLNILGDDFGQFQNVSDKGLKRHAESPLEPVMRTPKAWERVKPLPGIQWARKQFRRLFDAERYPERFEPNVAMEGGPTMNKRSSLATFPFPITSQ